MSRRSTGTIGVLVAMTLATTLAARADELPWETPRDALIPGNPGMPGGFHFMVNGFAQLENPGVDGKTLAGKPGGDTVPLLTDDWVMAYWRAEDGWAETLFMLDFEALTVGAAGYPELGQAGEGLWDAQHAHQLIHQAMVAFHPLAETEAGAVTMDREGDVDLTLFGGIGGATIGPPIFMHRLSAPGPTVPRKHHKGENPHETTPVFGASFRAGALTVEGSAFSGLELTPADSRLYPHWAPPASYAGRVRWLAEHEPGRVLELQVSGERLRDQGPMVPDAWQGSASATFGATLDGWRVDSLLDYGIDAPDGGPSSQGLLLESALRDPTHDDTGWTRLELNQRQEPDGEVSSPWFFASLGFERVVLSGAGLRLGIFAEATYGRIPDSLQMEYGHQNVVTLNLGLHLFGMWMLDEDGQPMNMHRD